MLYNLLIPFIVYSLLLSMTMQSSIILLLFTGKSWEPRWVPGIWPSLDRHPQNDDKASVLPWWLATASSLASSAVTLLLCPNHTCLHAVPKICHSLSSLYLEQALSISSHGLLPHFIQRILSRTYCWLCAVRLYHYSPGYPYFPPCDAPLSGRINRSHEQLFICFD